MGPGCIATADTNRHDRGNRGGVPALDESASHAALRAEWAPGIAGQVLRRRRLQRERAAYRARRSAIGLQPDFRNGRDAVSVVRPLARTATRAKDGQLRILDRR